MRPALPIPSAQVVFTDLGGSEGILVDLQTTKYYRVNETAMLVWRALESKKTWGEVVDAMTAAYDVSPEHAAESVQRLLRTMRVYSLVH